MKTIKTLSTDRLLLRDYVVNDFDRVHIYGADPEFSKYELWGPNSKEDTQIFIETAIQQAEAKPRFKFELAVCLRESGLLIGGCGIRRETEESHVASLGWAIHPEFQRNGYATEAARAVIEFGFQVLGLSVIFATCDARNIASFTVMKKVGMRRVGFTRGEKEVKGHMRDSYRYEILSSK